MEDGLRFECQPGCIRCCDTEGFVYLTPADFSRIAAFLGLSEEEFQTRYVFRTRRLIRLRKPRHKQCPFLTDGGCSVHPVKPAQCRLYPFWPELVTYRDIWEHEGRCRCPGIGKGALVQIGAAVEIAEEMKTSYPWFYRGR